MFNMPQKDLRATNMAKWEWNNRPPSSRPDTDAELVEVLFGTIGRHRAIKLQKRMKMM